MQRAAQQAAVNAPLAPPGAEFRRFGPQPPPGQHGAERFGNHRCHGGAYNAKAQSADKDQVQRCVQNGRYHQKAQRRSGIAHTFEPRRQRIVKAGERCPQKGNAQIDGRDRKNLPRNRTGLKNRRGQQYPQQCHHCACRRAGKHGGGQFPAQAFAVLCAKELAHQHPGPQADTGNSQNNQVHHRARNALGRQGILADETPRNDGIHRVIRQLEPVAQHQRHGIAQQVPRRAAFGHILHGAHFCCAGLRSSRSCSVSRVM